ncbi:MAG: PfkB family carbohydrate kinase [Pseudomonadota bacterium]
MSLLVVGALHWDVVVRAERLPRLDETLPGQGVDYRFGGKGGNQAIAAARAGADVAFAGRIGADAAGRYMKRTLDAASVDIEQLQEGPGASGMSVAIVEARGDYGAVIVSAENRSFDPAQVQIPNTCKLVLVQNELPKSTLAALANLARDAGAEFWMNAAPATGLSATDLKIADVVIANRVEGADLTDETGPPEAVMAALRDLVGGRRIVLTLGAGGVMFTDGAHTIHAPAHQIPQGSVSHGAGDVFTGTLAAHVVNDAPFEAAVAAAQRAAADHIAQSR